MSAPAEEYRLADFTTDTRVFFLSAIAVVLGVVGTYLAWILLRLIYFFTNLFFYLRWSFEPVSPAGHHLGLWVIAVPATGGLIVGLMARYGSEKIRGHGIPEAIEAILLKGAKVEPKLAVLKPISAAVAIGSGGPFGAEGPIIMTGGAVGSLIAQFFKFSSAERKTLLVCGASAGMAAVFATPVSAVLLAVELLLFEWKPRSLIPVALASATAGILRRSILGIGPLFPTPAHEINISVVAMVGCAVVGLLAGILAALLSTGIYWLEDSFHKVRVHWMWWPAIGGIAVGIGGYFFPQALGVGYDVIGNLLAHDLPLKLLLGILIVKALIWTISLGSGTSGGVLAPLLMMGAALGGIESRYMPRLLPNYGEGFWALVSMAAVLAGAMSAPLTAIVFAFELTHDAAVLLPLLISALVSYGFTVLTLPRSILTEKLSRRGYHLSREFTVDPMESLFVRDVVRKDIATVPVSASAADLERALKVDPKVEVQRLFPVLDANGSMAGVVTRFDLEQVARRRTFPHDMNDCLRPQPRVAYTDEPLRQVVHRMALTGITKFPVVERSAPSKVIGLVALTDLLKARVLAVETENRREAVLQFPLISRWTGKKQLEEQPPNPD